jgi:hypothetical protein
MGKDERPGGISGNKQLIQGPRRTLQHFTVGTPLQLTVPA